MQRQKQKNTAFPLNQPWQVQWVLEGRYFTQFEELPL